MSPALFTVESQQQRNSALLAGAKYMRPRIESQVLPFSLDMKAHKLTPDQLHALQALELEAARIAIRSLASLAKIGELDHLGGGLDLLAALTLTMAVSDRERVTYTIENAHTSIGYFSALAAMGFVEAEVVIEKFRRSIDIPGHVSWLPGGTELNGGRLGVMIPVAAGQALGLKARHGADAWVLCHCGDAAWISGQALNGFNGAHLHKAPITFVMHRNGIQLSDSNKKVLDKDPRIMIAAMGIEILEIPSLHDTEGLYQAYCEARKLASEGRPNLIYPTGYRSGAKGRVDLREFGRKYGIEKDVEAFAAKNNVAMDTEIWIPGALMSYRDVISMMECVFLVNDLPGGKDHHDGHMKGRDEAVVLGHSMLQPTSDQKRALADLRAKPKRSVITEARPAPGSANLVVGAEARRAVKLPAAGEAVSPRAGSEAAYDLVAKTFPEDVFVVSCDLDPSTKLGKARKHLKRDHQFELSIEEQVACLMTDGLAMSSRKPQLNVISTFAAFYEGIAREGFELWRYQRNLNGVNEGLNVAFHLSHVGASTGRDHFSGWSLDWITLALGYLPYLDRFYAPADARAAFVAVMDMAARYGAHIVAIPRDNLPVLTKQGSSAALFEADSAFEAVTPLRSYPGARRAILALGAPAFVAVDAAERLHQEGFSADVHLVNGLPLPDGWIDDILRRYPEGVVTIEDGIIATRKTGLRGFAGLVCSAASTSKVRTEHVGITDPRVAPADGMMEVWEHFGITAKAVTEAVRSLG